MAKRFIAVKVEIKIPVPDGTDGTQVTEAIMTLLGHMDIGRVQTQPRSLIGKGDSAIEVIAALLDRAEIRHMSSARLYDLCRGLVVGSATFYKTPRAFSRAICSRWRKIERDLQVTMDVEKTDRTRFFTITKRK